MRKRIWNVGHLGALAGALCVFVGRGNAQQVTAMRIPDGVTCARCEIVLEQTVTIGADTGAGALMRDPLRMTVDGRGRYWVLVSGELPQIYGPDGEFIRILGRRGGGPGEFGDPSEVVGISGDSVLVLDQNPRRLSVVAPDLHIARTIRDDYPFNTILPVAWPKLVWMSGMSYSPALAGLPLHVAELADTGVLLHRSFAPETEELRPRQSGLLTQHLAAGASGSVWSAHLVKYQISRWTPEGTLIQSIVRDAKWLPAGLRPTVGGPRVPPTPRIVALAEGSDGLLWVFGWVAAATYPDAWPRTPFEGGEIDIRRIRTNKLFTTVVEVLDTRAGRVVARREVDDWIVRLLPGGRAASYYEDSDDIGRIKVWRFTLRQPR